MTTVSRESDVSAEKQVRSFSQPVVMKMTLVLSAIALVISGISLAGWAQASAERQEIETRLACLELPGPNDCGLDGR